MAHLLHCQESANALDCVKQLEEMMHQEKGQLAGLNDQFVDFIEKRYYMEAEHRALTHERDFLRTGVHEDSAGIKHIYQSEISNIKIYIDDIVKDKKHLSDQEASLLREVDEYRRKWVDMENRNHGIASEIDNEFIRLSNIEAENALTLRRLKYMEEKNRSIKDNNQKIAEYINIIKMRKDQAVNLQQEYSMRKNELLLRIRTLQSDNDAIIMNEHKYFGIDRSANRHEFRDYLHKAIGDIRANYEAIHFSTFEQMKKQANITIEELNKTYHNTGDDDMFKITKEKERSTRKQLYEIEMKNAELAQKVQSLQLQLSEDLHIYQITLDHKQLEIDKLREECERMKVELERLCDVNISLRQEIQKYRDLLDATGSNHSVNLDYPTPRSHQYQQYLREDHLYVAPDHQSIVRSDSRQNVLAESQSYLQSHSETITSTESQQTIVPQPQSSVPAYHGSIETIVLSDSQRNVSTDLQPTIQSYQETITTTESKDNVLPQPPLHSSAYHGLTGSNVLSNSYQNVSTDFQPNIQSYREIITTTESQNNLLPQPKSHSSVYHDVRSDSWRNVQPEPYFTPRLHSTAHHDSEQIHHSASKNGSGETIIEHYQQQKNDEQGSKTFISFKNSGIVQKESCISAVHSEDDLSFEEENFQRFTRWYRGKIKITDVTPDYIRIENRSSKHSVDVGRFKIIHEFGNKSVYTELPSGLILRPKEGVKIYAQNSQHESGDIVAEIRNFDTSIKANTSLRNTNNEVKSWFVYVSNTEINENHSRI